jgi:urease accessory protein
MKIETCVTQEGRPLFIEKGEINGGGRLMRSPVGLGGRSVVGTLVATHEGKVEVPGIAITRLPGLLVARYFGDSSEEALQGFIRVWKALRPSAVEPRIWST